MRSRACQSLCRASRIARASRCESSWRHCSLDAHRRNSHTSTCFEYGSAAFGTSRSVPSWSYPKYRLYRVQSPAVTRWTSLWLRFHEAHFSWVWLDYSELHRMPIPLMSGHCSARLRPRLKQFACLRTFSPSASNRFYRMRGHSESKEGLSQEMNFLGPDRGLYPRNQIGSSTGLSQRLWALSFAPLCTGLLSRCTHRKSYASSRLHHCQTHISARCRLAQTLKCELGPSNAIWSSFESQVSFD